MQPLLQARMPARALQVHARPRAARGVRSRADRAGAAARSSDPAAPDCSRTACTFRESIPIHRPWPSPRTPPIYTTPQDAALAFYQAFEAARRRRDDGHLGRRRGHRLRASGRRAARRLRRGARRLGAAVLRRRACSVSASTRSSSIETVGLAMQSAIEHVTAGRDGNEQRRRALHQRLPAHAVRLADGRAPRVGGAAAARFRGHRRAALIVAAATARRRRLA